MGCAKTYNQGGSQHAAQKLAGPLDLGGAGAVFRWLAHFGLLVQWGYYNKWQLTIPQALGTGSQVGRSANARGWPVLSSH